MADSIPDQRIYCDEFILDAPLTQVAAFIGDAQRILDYYPVGLRAQNMINQQQLSCYSLIGASLLERDNELSNDTLLVFKVYNCLATHKNLNAVQFKQQAFFTMFEDWQLQSLGNKTRIRKTWRNIEQQRFHFIPKLVLTTIIRLTAKLERKVLIRCWNQAAKNEHNNKN